MTTPPITALSKISPEALQDPKNEEILSIADALTPREIEPEVIAGIEILLIRAEKYSNLGNWTKARRNYEEVLTIDKYNTAARHGLKELKDNMSNAQ